MAANPVSCTEVHRTRATNVQRVWSVNLWHSVSVSYIYIYLYANTCNCGATGCTDRAVEYCQSSTVVENTVLYCFGALYHGRDTIAWRDVRGRDLRCHRMIAFKLFAELDAQGPRGHVHNLTMRESFPSPEELMGVSKRVPVYRPLEYSHSCVSYGIVAFTESPSHR
jgi:hypothetical protein